MSTVASDTWTNKDTFSTSYGHRTNPSPNGEEGQSQTEWCGAHSGATSIEKGPRVYAARPRNPLPHVALGDAKHQRQRPLPRRRQVASINLALLVLLQILEEGTHPQATCVVFSLVAVARDARPPPTRRLGAHGPDPRAAGGRQERLGGRGVGLRQSEAGLHALHPDLRQPTQVQRPWSQVPSVRSCEPTAVSTYLPRIGSLWISRPSTALRW